MKIHVQPPIHGVFIIDDPEKEVKLQVTMGKAGHEGVTAIGIGALRLDDELNSFTLNLGKAKEISGQLLHFTSTILDLSEEHNDLLYRVKLSAGNQYIYEKREKTVPDHGDGIQVSSFFTLISY